MSKSKKIVLYLLIAIVFISGFLMFFIISPKGDVVVIKSNGELIEKIDLKTVSKPYNFEVEHNGYNKIQISQSGAKVIESDCPDKICIQQSNSGIYPIVCLPHKLIIDKTNE